jgi:hypothetical protein
MPLWLREEVQALLRTLTGADPDAHASTTTPINMHMRIVLGAPEVPVPQP